MNLQPLLSTEKKDAKTLIVEVLSRKSPLSAKQAYNEVRKISSGSLTYQAIHKALKLLHSDGVVLRGEEGYSLSGEWISRAVEFLEGAKSGSGFPKLASLPDGASVSFNYRGQYAKPHYQMLAELDALIKARGKRSQPTIMHQIAAWPVMLLAGKEYLQMKSVSEPGNFYILDRFDSFYDRNTLEFWEKTFGAKWRCGVKSLSIEVFVIYDIVIQKYEDPQILKMFTKVQALSDKMHSIDFPELIGGAFEKKASLQFVVTRNQELADRIRKETMEHFR